MSVKVPTPSVEYQSLNHCQCDFCNTRRTVNEKKWRVSQKALQLQHAKLRNGYGCTAASNEDVAHYTSEHNPTCFNPDYPESVNQTARNADRINQSQRSTQIPHNLETCIMNNTNSKEDTNANELSKADKESALAKSQDNLDKLERLLIAEHKARVNAQLEADKLASTNAKGECTLQPQLFTSEHDYPHATKARATNCNNGMISGNSLYTNSTVDGINQHPFFNSSSGRKMNIHDAYELAHACPITPPVQCAASRKLQNTLNDLRAITSDPVNPHNREALSEIISNPVNGSTINRRVLNESIRENSHTSKNKEVNGIHGKQNEFGNSLAANRASMPHPYGAGVVWQESKRNKSNKNNNVTNTNNNTNNNKNIDQYTNSYERTGIDDIQILKCDDDNAESNGSSYLSPGAAAALSVQQQNALERESD